MGKHNFVAQRTAEEARRAAELKLSKLCGSLCVLSGSLRNKKMQKRWGMGNG